MQVSDLVGIRVDLKSGDSMNTSIEYNGNDKGLHVWVSYSNVRPKDPILKVDFNVGMYVKDFIPESKIKRKISHSLIHIGFIGLVMWSGVRRL